MSPPQNGQALNSVRKHNQRIDWKYTEWPRPDGWVDRIVLQTTDPDRKK